MSIIKIDNELQLEPIEKNSTELQQRGERPVQKTREAAFLVGYLDTTTGQLLGCGVFSEEHPTMTRLNTQFQVTICKGYGKDYEEGLADLKNALDSPAYQWTKKFMKKSNGGL